MEIIWTRLARITYLEILENLKVRWTFKEVKHFHDLTNHVLQTVQNRQIEFPHVNSQLGVQKAIIHKNVSLYFKIENKNIYLITFFNNKMNPETLKNLLNNS